MTIWIISPLELCLGMDQQFSLDELSHLLTWLMPLFEDDRLAWGSVCLLCMSKHFVVGCDLWKIACIYICLDWIFWDQRDPEFKSNTTLEPLSTLKHFSIFWCINSILLSPCRESVRKGCLHSWAIIPNARSLSSLTFPFTGMFEWEEGLIPLAQSHRGNAPTQASL